MTAKGRRCLYCWKAVDTIGDFHPRCSKAFFGTSRPPDLEYSLDEMESLAGKVIRTHTTVPGIQPKIPLDFDVPGKGGRLTLVGLWGRFILKPPTRNYPSMPEVEDATMHLAEAGGIRTVPHAMIRLKSGELAFITKRIDRDDGRKIAMEDMCQLTERLTEDKYKGSMEQVGRTIRLHSTQGGLDAVNFFELALFCYLSGNADMHLKNFSLRRPGPGEIHLAPAYDLLATKLLLPKDPEESALALNGKKKNLRRKDFDALAQSLHITPKARDNAYSRASANKAVWSSLLDGSFMTPDLSDGFKRLLDARFARLGL